MAARLQRAFAYPLPPPPPPPPPAVPSAGLTAADVDAALAERAAARAAKDFAAADGVRLRLEAAGLALLDGPGGTEWRPAAMLDE